MMFSKVCKKNLNFKVEAFGTTKVRGAGFFPEISGSF
jgi:hypothetical protein